MLQYLRKFSSTRYSYHCTYKFIIRKDKLSNTELFIYDLEKAIPNWYKLSISVNIHILDIKMPSPVTLGEKIELIFIDQDSKKVSFRNLHKKILDRLNAYISDSKYTLADIQYISLGITINSTKKHNRYTDDHRLDFWDYLDDLDDEQW